MGAKRQRFPIVNAYAICWNNMRPGCAGRSLHARCDLERENPSLISGDNPAGPSPRSEFSLPPVVVGRRQRDARIGFSSIVDKAMKGEFVTITRHGKPVAVLVSIEAADIAREALGRRRPRPCRLSANFPRWHV